MENITWDEFIKVEIRVGTIIKVDDFPEARKPAYKVMVDLGKEIGVKQSSAQITDLYSKEALINKQVIVIINLLPNKIGPFISECLVTGFYREDKELIDFFNKSKGHKPIIVPFTPTAENVAKFIFNEIENKFEDNYNTGLHLHSIKLWETPTSYAIYTKNDNK